MHILREHDGLLYVVFLSTMTDDPVVLRRWYPTGIKTHHAHHNLGVESLDGAVLVPDRPGFYRFSDPGYGRVEVELERGGSTLASHIDHIAAEPPATRRRGRVRWDMGHWEISGHRKRELLATENQIIRDPCLSGSHTPQNR